MKSKKIYSLVLSAALALGTFAPSFATDTDNLKYMTNSPFASGYNDVINDPDGKHGGFRPEDFITRAEVAVLLTRAFDLTKSGSTYSDSKTHWGNEFIGAVQKAGYIAGYPDGTYKPDAVITRAELATILNKIYKGNKDLGAKAFRDVTADDWFRPHVEAASRKGIVAGYVDGSFGPMDRVTRAHAVTMILNTLERKVDPDLPKFIESRFSDVDENAWYAPYVMAATEIFKYRVNADGTENVVFDTSFEKITSAKTIDMIVDKNKDYAQIKFTINGFDEPMTRESLIAAGYTIQYYIVDPSNGNRVNGVMKSQVVNQMGELYNNTGEFDPSVLTPYKEYKLGVVIASDTDDTYITYTMGTVKTVDPDYNIVKDVQSIKFKNYEARRVDSELLQDNATGTADIDHDTDDEFGTACGIQNSNVMMQGELLLLDSLKGSANDKTDVELKDFVTKVHSSNPDVAEFKYIAARELDATDKTRGYPAGEYLVAKREGTTVVTFTVGTVTYSKEIKVVKNNADQARKVSKVTVEPGQIGILNGKQQTFKLTILDQYGDPMDMETGYFEYQTASQSEVPPADPNDVIDFFFLRDAKQRRNYLDNQGIRENFHRTYDNLNIVIPHGKDGNPIAKVFPDSIKLNCSGPDKGTYSITLEGVQPGDGVMYFFNETNEPLAKVNLGVTETKTIGDRELRKVNDYKKAENIELDANKPYGHSDNTAILNVAQLTKAGEFFEQVVITDAYVSDPKIVQVDLDPSNLPDAEDYVVKVTGLRAGETTLTVVDKDGKTYTTKITVKRDAVPTITDIEEWAGDHVTRADEIRNYTMDDLLPQRQIRTNLNVLYTTNPVYMVENDDDSVMDLYQNDKDGVPNYVGYLKVSKWVDNSVERDITNDIVANDISDDPMVMGKGFDHVIITEAEARLGATVLVKVYDAEGHVGYVESHKLYVNETN